jgi:hypothetical protein
LCQNGNFFAEFFGENVKKNRNLSEVAADAKSPNVLVVSAVRHNDLGSVSVAIVNHVFENKSQNDCKKMLPLFNMSLKKVAK